MFDARMSRRTSPFPPYLAFLCEHMRYSFMIRVPKRRRTGNSSIIVHRYTSLAIIHLGLRNTPQERLWKMGRLSPLRETRMEHPTHVRQPGRRQISIWNTIPGTHNLGLGPNSLEASTLRPNRDNCEFRKNSAKTYVELSSMLRRIEPYAVIAPKPTEPIKSLNFTHFQGKTTPSSRLSV